MLCEIVRNGRKTRQSDRGGEHQPLPPRFSTQDSDSVEKQHGAFRLQAQHALTNGRGVSPGARPREFLTSPLVMRQRVERVRNRTVGTTETVRIRIDSDYDNQDLHQHADRSPANRSGLCVCRREYPGCNGRRKDARPVQCWRFALRTGRRSDPLQPHRQVGDPTNATPRTDFLLPER